MGGGIRCEGLCTGHDAAGYWSAVKLGEEYGGRKISYNLKKVQG